jgi:hypothetical protein
LQLTVDSPCEIDRLFHGKTAETLVKDSPQEIPTVANLEVNKKTSLIQSREKQRDINDLDTVAHQFEVGAVPLNHKVS